MKNIKRSLSDLIGETYISAVCKARAALTGEDETSLLAIGLEQVDFYPESFSHRQEELMKQLMQQLVPAFINEETGAPLIPFELLSIMSLHRLTVSVAFVLGKMESCTLQERVNITTFPSVTPSPVMN